MVQVNRLTYQYQGSSLIVFPDFEVEAGKALVISGESGCGKTTLLHLLAGLRSAQEGQIIIDDIDISNLSPSQMDQYRGQHIGIVYQQNYFIQSLSVWDNLLISPYVTTKSKAKSIADRLHIGDSLSKHPNQLSVGQQQRVTIARAVMNEPKLILADEPTSALDNKNCEQVVNLLMEEATANNAALIIVTHDDRLKSQVDNCIELNALAG